MDRRLPIILIDEDISFMENLKQILEKYFSRIDIFIAENADLALNLLKEKGVPSVLFVSQRIKGSNGLMMVKEIKTDPLLKQCFIIFVSNAHDKEINLKAIQVGADDILHKPASIDQILCKLKISTNYLASQEKNKELYNEREKLVIELEEQILKVFLKLQDEKFHNLRKEINLFISASEWISNKLGKLNRTQKRNIKSAASMAYVPRLFLPDEILLQPITKNGICVSKTLQQIPEFINRLFENVNHLKEVKEILYHIFENFDGSGMPDKLQNWQIPLGSRILRIINDYLEMLRENGNNQSDAMDHIFHEVNRVYDLKLVVLFDQYLAEVGDFTKINKEKPVSIDTLNLGEVISRHIYTISGVKLVTAGAYVEEKVRQKIITINEKDPIIGSIYIYKS